MLNTMKKLPLEIKRIIWSYITSDKDLRACALVNWEWYSKYFARGAIGAPKWGTVGVPKWHSIGYDIWTESRDQQFGYAPFQSDPVLELGERGNIHDSVTILINKFETGGTQWYNRVYTPYIMELNLEYLKVDVKELQLKFTTLKTLVGDATQVLSLFTTSDVIQSKQLKNLSIKLTSQSVLEKVVEQLFDKLGETKFNIDRLKIEMWEDSGVEIAIEKTPSITRFLGQLTQVEIRNVYFEPAIFRYLSDLEILSMEGKIIMCEDWCQRAIQTTDSVFKYLGERLVKLKIDGQDQQSYFDYSKYSDYLKYLSKLQDRSVEHVNKDCKSLLGEQDYLGEVCDNINKYAQKLEFVAFRNYHVDSYHRDVAIEGLTQRGSKRCYSSKFQPYLDGPCDNEINDFGLNADGGPFFRPKELRMGTVDTRFRDYYYASDLPESGLAFRQLECMEFEIETDFPRLAFQVALFSFQICLNLSTD